MRYFWFVCTVLFFVAGCSEKPKTPEEKAREAAQKAIDEGLRQIRNEAEGQKAAKQEMMAELERKFLANKAQEEVVKQAKADADRAIEVLKKYDDRLKAVEKSLEGFGKVVEDAVKKALEKLPPPALPVPNPPPVFPGKIEANPYLLQQRMLQLQKELVVLDRKIHNDSALGRYEREKVVTTEKDRIRTEPLAKLGKMGAWKQDPDAPLASVPWRSAGVVYMVWVPRYSKKDIDLLRQQRDAKIQEVFAIRQIFLRWEQDAMRKGGRP